MTPTADASFESFYRDEMAGVVALGIALTGDRERGYELAQDVMLRAA